MTDRKKIIGPEVLDCRRKVGKEIMQNRGEKRDKKQEKNGTKGNGKM